MHGGVWPGRLAYILAKLDDDARDHQEDQARLRRDVSLSLPHSLPPPYICGRWSLLLAFSSSKAAAN
jgi:hypothetical protein